jgi:hypothetical protein
MLWLGKSILCKNTQVHNNSYLQRPLGLKGGIYSMDIIEQNVPKI